MAGELLCIDSLKRECHRVQRRLDELRVTSPAFAPDEDGATSEGAVRATVERELAGVPADTRARVLDEWFGWGPLEVLLERDDATEILVNGPDAIWFERAGKLERHSDRFLSPTTFRNFVVRMGQVAGAQPTLDSPFADGQWGEFRVHMALGPSASVPAAIALRRHPKQPWTFARLADSNWAPAPALEALRTLVRDRCNFLVVGGTGAGKTSVLNACLAELPHSERCVVIEDTSELSLPNEASVKLLARRDPHGMLRTIDQADLVRQSLRMRPDRIVMGEVRGPEAKDLLMAFATGHTGCMGTLHADSARQALLRLEMLIQLGAPQWNLHAVRTLIYLSVRAVVVVGRDADGGRRLEGVHRIAALEDVGFLTERIA